MNPENDYQFVMIPQQLSSCLDANCNKMLSILLGLHTLLSKEDGWFYRSNKDLQLDTRLSQNLVIATLDTLYQAGIIDVDCVGKGRGHRSNRIYINFESFKVYQQYSFNDIRNNPDLWIETVPYKNHYSPSYCKDNGKEIGNTLGKRIGKKVTTNTNTINTLNNINKIEDINLKEENINNLKLDNDMLVLPVIEKESFYNEEERNIIEIDAYSISKKEEESVVTVSEATPETEYVPSASSLDNSLVTPIKRKVPVFTVNRDLLMNCTNPFKLYLDTFIETYKDVDYTMDSDAFNILNKDYLQEFKHFFKKELDINFSEESLSFHLRYYKATGRIYQYEEKTITA